MEDLPLNLSIPKHKPFFTNILIIVIATMFLVQTFLVLTTGDLEKVLIILGAKWNYGIKHGEYYRFITCAFLHGSIVHLLLNLVTLNAFGKELETIFGRFRFLLIFFISAWGASLTSFIFSPYLAIGASGAVFGIIGSLTMFFYKQKDKLVNSDAKFKSMYTLAGLNLIFGFLIPNIDYLAHIGGLITGGAISYFISPDYIIDTTSLKIKEKNKQAFEIIGLLIICISLYFISMLYTT